MTINRISSFYHRELTDAGFAIPPVISPDQGSLAYSGSHMLPGGLQAVWIQAIAAGMRTGGLTDKNRTRIQATVTQFAHL
jgi:hypothetical protein